MSSTLDPNHASINRHSDFEKIHNAFLSHYAQNPQLGETRYLAWLKALNLDDSKPYCKPQERFQWAKTLIEQVKEDSDSHFYKVEALFPLESMNGNIYTREELLQATRTLTGKPSNLNHNPSQKLVEVEILAAQFEDDVAECFVRILKTSPIPAMIEQKQIVNVSVEADWSHGTVGKGLIFEGLAWLTKDVLPGVPLTRIEPVEKIAESFNQPDLPGTEQTKIQTASANDQAGPTQIEPLNNDELKKLIKTEIAEALRTQQTQENTQLQNDLTKKTEKLSETEQKLTETRNSLAEAKKTIEQIQKQVSNSSLLKNPTQTIAISEHIKVLESLLPAPMVEKSTLGMQRECQAIRSAIFQAKEKQKET